MQKPWPTVGSVSFEALAEPLARWLRAYQNGCVEGYDGFALGTNESSSCLQPEDALTPQSLDHNRTNQGRDVFDVVIGLAIQLGIEQGRRLSK